MFSYRDLSVSQADELADAYFVLDRDYIKIGKHYGLEYSLAQKLMLHPLTRAAIRRKAREMSKTLYTREEHLAFLKKIRDAAFGDDNYKVALSAEIAVGKAAGLYENIREEDGDGKALPDPTSMSTEQLKAQLAKALPAPGTEHLMGAEQREKAVASLRDDDVDEGAF